MATNRFYLLEPDYDAIDVEPSDLVVDKSAANSLYYSNMRPVPGNGGGWSWGNLRHINYYLQNSHNCADEAYPVRNTTPLHAFGARGSTSTR